jgi:predicted phage tail component-like protein
MVRFTSDGRFIFNNELSDEGDPTIINGLFLMDMERVYTLVSHTVPQYTLDTTLQNKAVVGSYVSFQVVLECVNYIDPGDPLSVDVPLPSGFSLVGWMSNEGTYSQVTGKWIPTLDSSDKATLDFILSVDSAGSVNHVVTLDGDATVTDTNSCTVSATDTASIYYTDIVIDDTLTLSNLQDGEWYTITAYNWINDTGISGVYDGVRNNRLTVINGGTVYGSRVTDESTWTRTRCSFIYDSSETLTLRLYGQYQSVSTSAVDEWAGFLIREYSRTDSYSAPVNLLSDPDLLLINGSDASATVPAGEDTATYELIIGSLPPLTGVNPFFKGLELNIGVGDITSSQIQSQVITADGLESDTKTTVGNTTSDVIIGDETDLWGFNSQDIEEKSLTIELSLSNLSATSTTFTLNNIYLTLHWQLDLTNGALGFTYNGEHSRIYDLYLNDNDNPEGADTEINTLKLPYTDGELLINQNIRKKTVTITFTLWGSSITEVEDKLLDIGEWLGNDRDNFNNPVAKELIFDYNPTRVYNAILDGSISVENHATSLRCKAKFLISSGVAESTTTKVTGAVGQNNGITKVRPVLTLTGQDAATITITDSITGQSLTINTIISEGQVFTVDCINRTVTDSSGNDYSTDVDINSQWFGFYNNYNLTTVGATLQSVEFTEAY